LNACVLFFSVLNVGARAVMIAASTYTSTTAMTTASTAPTRPLTIGTRTVPANGTLTPTNTWPMNAATALTAASGTT
jgi:hypothetical protein